MDRLETYFKFIYRFTKNAINAINNAKKCKKAEFLSFELYRSTQILGIFDQSENEYFR